MTLGALWGLLAGSTGGPRYVGGQVHSAWSGTDPAELGHELDLLQDAGANAVRIDIAWSSLETEGKGRRSSWYVDKIDSFMAAAEARGLEVIATFHATPCWASRAPADKKLGCEGEWWERGVTQYPPRDARDYADAAAWVAERWGPRLAGFEVWNEPNESSQYFWRTPDQTGDYVRLLKAAYPALKAVRPNLPVAAGALSFSDGEFARRLYELGAEGYFDVFSIHPYAEAQPPARSAQGEARKWSFASGVPWIRRIMLAHGDDKPLWLTEFGWTSCRAASEYGQRRCVSAEDQARYTRRAWTMIADWPYVEAATQYNLRNKGTDPTGVEAQYGLVQRNFQPKPAFSAFAAGIDRSTAP